MLYYAIDQNMQILYFFAIFVVTLLSDWAAHCESPFVLLWKLRERTNYRNRANVITYAIALNARTAR